MYGLTNWRNDNWRNDHRGEHALACSVSSRVFLNGGDIGIPFVVMGDSFQRGAPVGLGRNPAFKSFTGSRTRGMIAAIALQPPYRAENDSRAAALQYQPGKWPLVPLQGDIVRDTPGPLEVYQSNWAFRSRSDAGKFVQIIRHSNATQPQTTPASLGTVDEAYLWQFPTQSPEKEYATALVARTGGVVIEVSVRGGHGLSPALAERLGSEARDNLKVACGL